MYRVSELDSGLSCLDDNTFVSERFVELSIVTDDYSFFFTKAYFCNLETNHFFFLIIELIIIFRCYHYFIVDIAPLVTYPLK